MRYMIIVKATNDSEAGVMPSADLMAAMGRFNDELIQAGVLLAGEGLQASSQGSRIKYTGGKHVVKDGPFETKELIAGFWIIDVKSKGEALEWVKRIPFDENEEIELRKVFEASDFPAELVGEEDLRKERAWREANAGPITA